MIPLREDLDVDAISDFVDELKSIYHDYFPDSCLVATLVNMESTLSVICYLAKDKSELYSGCLDAFSISIGIRNTVLDGSELDITAPLQMIFVRNVIRLSDNAEGTLITSNETVYPNGYVIDGDQETILKEFEKFCSKLYKKTLRLYNKGMLWDSGHYDIEDKL